MLVAYLFFDKKIIWGIDILSILCYNYNEKIITKYITKTHKNGNETGSRCRRTAG